MMKIISWTIINNEIDFIKLIVKHSDWLDGMYFLNTSDPNHDDGTLQFLKEIESDKIIVEQYKHSYIAKYNSSWEEMKDPFPEVEVRNYALSRVEEIFNSDWLIQLDGDEIFLPETKQTIETLANKAWIIGHHTINPVCELKYHPQETRHRLKLYDPHARIWKAKLKVRYQNNPAFKDKQYHCIPALQNRHLFHHNTTKFTDIPLHFHLHWMYGKKIEGYYHNMNVFDKHQMIKNQNGNQFSYLVPEDFWKARQDWLLS